MRRAHLPRKRAKRVLRGLPLPIGRQACLPAGRSSATSASFLKEFYLVQSLLSKTRMLNVTDLRANTIFIHSDGELYRVLKYEHIKMGRGSATIKVKVKALRSGAIKDISFVSGAKVEEADVTKKQYEFVYFDKRKSKAILSDPETKQRTEVEAEVIGEGNLKFLKTGVLLTVLASEDEEILSCEISIMAELKVAETAGSEKGDTAGSAKKPATLETGAVITVPMFIKTGDVIRVNTESGEYVERVT
ncbi:MAG: Elongation factor P [candidate division CPR1 bacterium GW2011_GWA2_42_17]|uniref:Elongation factor P n=1 Tax=candidate division CPR1 bacterium GW2011_GWA2_42_17 TaxID=1618341 RepID=A0A0G0Z5I4_9BACT|nr:MAG: Elongation factor P [candidate division CPR1 bacterium GW2011_GWA2_42_17]